MVTRNVNHFGEGMWDLVKFSISSWTRYWNQDEYWIQLLQRAARL